jgi:hypothetical protein
MSRISRVRSKSTPFLRRGKAPSRGQRRNAPGSAGGWLLAFKMIVSSDSAAPEEPIPTTASSGAGAGEIRLARREARAIQSISRRVRSTGWKRRGRRRTTGELVGQVVDPIRDVDFAGIVPVGDIKTGRTQAEPRLVRTIHPTPDCDRIRDVDLPDRIIIATHEQAPTGARIADRARTVPLIRRCAPRLRDHRTAPQWSTTGAHLRTRIRRAGLPVATPNVRSMALRFPRDSYSRAIRAYGRDALTSATCPRRRWGSDHRQPPDLNRQDRRHRGRWRTSLTSTSISPNRCL